VAQAGRRRDRRERKREGDRVRREDRHGALARQRPGVLGFTDAVCRAWPALRRFGRFRRQRRAGDPPGRARRRDDVAAAGSYYASPLAADGKIYVTNEDGVVTVLAAKPSFQVLATNDVGERTLASPAVSDRTIFLRSDEHLWAIR
jgi:outer membrane protein assembly factor BamB